ncbi:MAG: hypothetical protein ACF8K1_12655 [Phycisphaerales bacterium JB047]
MSDTTTTTLATFGDNRDTWRFASIACGVLLLISLAAHLGGPSSAHAAPPMNQLAITQQQAQQSLRIGGFTTIDDQPAFIVLNDQGQRIGKLPMNLTPDQDGDGVE